MIWTAGRIVPEDSLAIGVRDRAFEHGLGLFETFRTWEGSPSLLARHLARLTRSAAALRLPIAPGSLPDADDVAALLRANEVTGDVLLRLTLSGGVSETAGGVAWLRAGPLPPSPRGPGAIVEGTWGVSYDDPTIRHKCLNYWPRRLAHERATALGADEALSVTPDGLLWEGSRTNLFLVLGDILATPKGDGPLLPGIMRGVVLERAQTFGIEAIEGEFSADSFEVADEAFLTNSVRGIIPIARLFSRQFRAPGPVTRQLREDVRGRLAGTILGS